MQSDASLTREMEALVAIVNDGRFTCAHGYVPEA
jgi:hypothetical protein